MEYNKDINSLLLIREYMLAMDKKLIINNDEELIDLFLTIDEENKTPTELRKYIKINLYKKKIRQLYLIDVSVDEKTHLLNVKNIAKEKNWILERIKLEKEIFRKAFGEDKEEEEKINYDF